jgi:hypothetical protein
MVLIKRSVETPRSPCIAASSLAWPTSRRPCRRADHEEASNHNAQYPRIPSKVLKGASNEEGVNDIIVEVAMSGTVADEAVKYVDLEHMECRDTQISCIATRSLVEPPEACRPKEGLKSIVPKHPEALGRAIKRAPHREAFIPT